VVGARRRLKNRRGFTLFEVLCAVAVASVGAAVFVSLFSSSLALLQVSRDKGIAASLAEEQALYITHNPAQFDWRLQGAAPGALAEIKPVGFDPKKDRQVFPLPGAMPAEPDAARTQKNLYEKFTWQAFAQVPEPAAASVTFHVVVQWSHGVHGRTFSVCASVPRQQLTMAAARPEGK
jgi:prepilin-type N-terminal cleavage/methylation domain-containing protein